MKENNLNIRVYQVPYEDILTKVKSKMSYSDILKNTHTIKEEVTSFIPADIIPETISTSTSLLDEEAFLFVLDVSTIFEKKPYEDMVSFIPVYRFLLESYDVSVEQFLEDFCHHTAGDVTNEMTEEQITDKKENTND